MSEVSDSIRVALVAPGADPTLEDIENAIRAERSGEIAVLYQALLNSPPIASGWEAMLTAVRNRTTIPADLREMIILRVAVLNRATFEFAAHEPIARGTGVDSDQIEAIRSFPQGTEQLSRNQQLVLRLTDQMTREIDVPEEVIVQLREEFGNRGLVELVATVAAYNMVSRFLVALNIVH